MRPEDIRDFVQRRPFQPFRMTLTDGRSYEIRHPELAMVGRSTVAIGLPAADDPRPIYDRVTACDADRAGPGVGETPGGAGG